MKTQTRRQKIAELSASNKLMVESLYTAKLRCSELEQELAESEEHRDFLANQSDKYQGKYRHVLDQSREWERKVEQLDYDLTRANDKIRDQERQNQQQEYTIADLERRLRMAEDQLRYAHRDY